MAVGTHLHDERRQHTETTRALRSGWVPDGVLNATIKINFLKQESVSHWHVTVVIASVLLRHMETMWGEGRAWDHSTTIITSAQPESQGGAAGSSWRYQIIRIACLTILLLLYRLIGWLIHSLENQAGYYNIQNQEEKKRKISQIINPRSVWMSFSKLIHWLLSCCFSLVLLLSDRTLVIASHSFVQILHEISWLHGWTDGQQRKNNSPSKNKKESIINWRTRTYYLTIPELPPTKPNG